MSEKFRKNIELFNRKERYLVVKAATECGFALSEDFREQLIEASKRRSNVDFDLPDRQQIYVAMDYHFDWIYASLFLAEQEVWLDNYPRNNDLIKGNQEDVDLLLVYPGAKDPTTTHVIMVEAKGDTPWTTKQSESKAKRLLSIFGEDGRKWANIVPHFLIWSPKKTRLKSKEFPEWAQGCGEDNPFIHLLSDFGLNKTLKITCCQKDPKKNQSPQKAEFWKVESRC